MLSTGGLAGADDVTVQGREDDLNEPARHAHCDMTLESLSDTIRMCRRDISALARPSIEAEERRQVGAPARVPRYAAYSVWVCFCRIRELL